MSEYHKIETLFERDEKTFKVIPEKLRKPVFGMLKAWDFTEKLDGTNIRIIWQDKTVAFAGKSDKAVMPPGMVDYLCSLVSAEKLAAVFPEGNAVIYGEGYGAGIQGGGSYTPQKTFAMFDVLVDGKWWLDWENTRDVAQKLGIPTVPYFGEMPLDEAVEMVRSGFRSAIPGATAMAEGLVGRPKETLFDKKGARVIIKIKTKDF